MSKVRLKKFPKSIGSAKVHEKNLVVAGMAFRVFFKNFFSSRQRAHKKSNSMNPFSVVLSILKTKFRRLRQRERSPWVALCFFHKSGANLRTRLGVDVIAKMTFFSNVTIGEIDTKNKNLRSKNARFSTCKS